MHGKDPSVSVYRPPLNPAEIGLTVQAVGRRVGLDVTGAEMIKFTNNAVLRLPAAGTVLRIAGSAVIGARATRVVRAARRLERHGVPAVRLRSGVDQPVVLRGHEITIWDDVPSVRGPVASDLARLLTSLHAIRSEPSDLPGWDPVGGVRARIAAAGDTDPAVIGFLADECDAVAADLAAITRMKPLLDPGLMHGDAFLGNVVVGPDGPVLCDFDSTCRGPREWDLTPVAAGARRFDGGGHRQREMAEAYGVDVTGWAGFGALRRLRELQLVTSVLPVLGANPALRPQWRVRLDSLRRRDEEARWTPYALA